MTISRAICITHFRSGEILNISFHRQNEAGPLARNWKYRGKYLIFMNLFTKK